MLYKQLDKVQLLAYILSRRRKSRLNIAKQMTLKRLLRIYLMWYKFIHSGSKGTQKYANQRMEAIIIKKPINNDWLMIRISLTIFFSYYKHDPIEYCSS